MASCGASGLGRRGGPCRSGTARGRRGTADAGGGGRLGSGTRSSRPSSTRRMRPGRWPGASTSSMAVLSERTSTRLVQRGGPGRRGVGAQPGRLLDQGAPQGRGGRQAADRPAHARAAARIVRLRTAHAPGGDPAPRTRPAAHPSLPGRGRQRLPPAPQPRRPPAARHSPDPPQAQHRGSLRPRRSATYRRRQRVENRFARCKQYRALATRYDNCAASFRAAWVIVMPILWLPG